MPKRTFTRIIAFNAEGYSKCILDVGVTQVWSADARVRMLMEGPTIFPADFPEMERFVIQLEEKGSD